MKNRLKRISIFLIGTLFILLNCSIVYGDSLRKGEYSEKYKEWLQLSEEEKNNTIAPLPINIRKNNVDNSFKGKVRSVLKSITIPSSYDLRDYINIEVKNQMNTGECWAFTANTSLETYLALHNETYNFSERHIDYETSTSFIDGVNPYALKRKAGSGGFSSTAFTYYSRGSGPILEEDMPFENNESSIPLYELPRNVAIKKVDNMLYFPNIYKDYDENGNIIYMDANEVAYSKDEIIETRNQIKEHIMNNGGISVAIHAPDVEPYYNQWTHASFVNDLNEEANHAVTVIGWDDNYSKSNFMYKPKENGAYIVLNSWGSEWGDNGVYYVSYEDFLIESQMRGVVGVSDINYDNLYQYDISEMQNVLEYKYGANVFTAESNENLTEILIGSLSDQEGNVYVNTKNDNLNISDLTKIASNVKLNPGYNTISLNSPLHIEEGNKFAIVVEITSEEDVGIGIEDNNEVYFGTATSNEGESFISENGIDWEDIYAEDDMMNLSIKAYTQTDEKKFDVSDISGRAYTGLGGMYTFSIDTSYIYAESKIDIKILNSLEEDITDKFEISGNEIRGKGTFVKINCPYDIEQGQYEVVVTEPNSNNTVSNTFQVSANNGNYITAKFKDEIFWSYIKSKVKDAIVDRKNLTISAPEVAFALVRKVSDTYGKEITDISGIEYLTNLESINLNDNNIVDLTPLSNLHNLKKLYIEVNDIVDFSPLSNLNSLEELHLGGNDMSNGLEFLQYLNNLKELRLHDSGTPDEIDISYIFDLHKLEYLDLTLWKWITEEHLQRIGELTNLKQLYLDSCNIGNIDFIEGLNLTSLSIGNGTIPSGTNHISDLSPIRNMTTLKELDISQLSKIETLDDIANLSNLECFWCLECTLRDASALDSDVFKNTTWSVLWLPNGRFSDKFIHSDNDLIIEVPVIIQQAANENSLLYSSSGLSLYNCEWEEYGKTIRVKANISSFSITINDGYAENTIYSASIIDGKLGDLNKNDKIDLQDIIILLKKYLGVEDVTEEDIRLGDMNYNGKIDLSDVILLLKAYLGIN